MPTRQDTKKLQNMAKNNQKVKLHEFNPVLYPLKLWIVKNPTSEAIQERFKQHDEKEIIADFNNVACASTYNTVIYEKNTGNYGILVSIHSRLNISDIAHESTHVAKFMWEWLGEDIAGLESDAYLVGWIADCISQVNTGRFKDNL